MSELIELMPTFSYRAWLSSSLFPRHCSSSYWRRNGFLAHGSLNKVVQGVGFKEMQYRMNLMPHKLGHAEQMTLAATTLRGAAGVVETQRPLATIPTARGRGVALRRVSGPLIHAFEDHLEAHSKIVMRPKLIMRCTICPISRS